MPENFSGKEVWKGIITPVNNQGSCGSCWAFATVGTLSDRFNIQSQGRYKLNLSVANMIICSHNVNELSNVFSNQKTLEQSSINEIQTSGCYGNSLINAFIYLYLA